MSKLLVLLVATLTACGGGSKAQAPVAAPAPAGVQLALGELKIIDVGKDKAVLIRADGTIEADGKPVGIRVTADGKVTKLDSNEVGFALQADGSIKGPSGETLDVRLDADGSITSGDKKISLDDKGLLVGSNPNAPQIRVEGATSPALRRTAMFVLITLTSPIQGEDKPPASTP